MNERMVFLSSFLRKTRTTKKPKHTVQYTDDVVQNCTPETYRVLVTNVTPINSIKKENLAQTHALVKFLCSSAS